MSRIVFNKDKVAELARDLAVKRNSATTGTSSATQGAASVPSAPTTSQPNAGGGYTGLAGLSSNTQQQLGKLGNGYTPSQSVAAAQQYLQNVVSGKPGNYQSQYQGQLESLYNQVMNRDPFKFDLNGDALYNQYRDQYTMLGQQAMMDTMGQAAAMTGGYGNSYAQTAGQQAYQGYLQQLNNIVPELYQMAWDRYNQEGNALRENLALTQSLEDSAYGRYRDEVSDWNNERGFASDEYWNQYNADYSNYANMLNYWNTLAGQENAQYNTDREFAYADRELAYNQAMAILQAGKTPSDELLAAAGISAADAKLLADANKKSSSSGGGNRSSGTGGNTNAPKTQNTQMGTLAKTLQSAWSKALKSGALDATRIAGLVATHERNGNITSGEADAILRSLGLN